ncbi:hypothetical protein [Kitasatospora sp. NPDC051914]|uniref:SCO2583/SCO2584 N-terminal domain-containing protein n=1 Tax=Kitasatospora sp. NPDC051914 TaxID=3154945 RepID=UPI003440EE4B
MPIAEDPSPRPADDSPDDPFDALVLDEEFVRAASVKEASGRARMLGAKWKRQPPEAVPWRAEADKPRDRAGRRSTQTDPWGRPKRRSRNWQAPLFVVLAGAVTLAALNVDGLRDWYHDRRDSSAAGTANRAPLPTLPPETAAPTTAPPAVDPDTPTVDRPWAGSPAAQWPLGAAAFVLPEPTAVGAFSAKQVGRQLEQVRDFLTLSTLDPKVLGGARPDAALAMLSREDRKRAEQRFAHPTQENSPAWQFPRFDPQSTVLATDEVRVQGRISVEGDGENGVMVHTDFTFVYALRPGPHPEKGIGQQTGGTAKPASWQAAPADTPAAGSGPVARTIIRSAVDFNFPNPKQFQVEPGKLYLDRYTVEGGNSGCDQSDGYFHPVFPVPSSDAGPSPSSGAPTVDPYDRSRPMDKYDGQCRKSSRT